MFPLILRFQRYVFSERAMNTETLQTKRPAEPPASSLQLLKREPRRSAGRLAATGGADLFLQPVKPDRADHHLLADHIARRTVHAHGLGELEVFLDRRFRFRARHVLFKLCHIETGILRSEER